jgi:hypothetical protein
MQVLIVYESVFGNTHRVATAIAAGISQASPAAAVDCVPVAQASADRVAGADLLVVGGPTHARGMTINRSRADAARSPAKFARKGAAAPAVDPAAEGPGLRTWFHGVPTATRGARAAAFDTRLENPLAGGAARGIARRLRGHGYAVVGKPQGFIVDEGAGPLRAGELDRAIAWGASLLTAGVRVG